MNREGWRTAAQETPREAIKMVEVLSVLAAHNLHLPPDTTMANLLERICTAGHKKREAHGAKARSGGERSGRSSSAFHEGDREKRVGGVTLVDGKVIDE
jgi:hypothetical protein